MAKGGRGFEEAPGLDGIQQPGFIALGVDQPVFFKGCRDAGAHRSYPAHRLQLRQSFEDKGAALQIDLTPCLHDEHVIDGVVGCCFSGDVR